MTTTKELVKEGKIRFEIYNFGKNNEFQAVKIKSKDAEASIQIQEYDTEQLCDMLAFMIYSFKIEIDDIKELIEMHKSDDKI